MSIDLRDHVLRAEGPWNADPERSRADRLILDTDGDQVILGGFLRIHVSFQLCNLTVPTSLLARDPALMTSGLMTGSLAARFAVLAHETHYSEVDHYILTIPAGQVWPYALDMNSIRGKLGSNSGYRVVIERSAFEEPRPVVQPSEDLPCDFAAANIPDTGRFFPAPCEPCAPGSSIGLPPGCGTTLAVPPAPGGCVRPRYYNGMLVTHQDMDSELRYHRLKRKLQNRAAGQGVVWGLDVGRVGGSICVLPGYAVDCCGNDLTVTTPYKVDLRTLLCDPAVAGQIRAGRARCLHLLLEYVECPELPRPIHGDVCSTQATRCEMSRVRETVRLRLVPPREHNPRGPISEFLEELDALRQDPDLAPFLPTKPATGSTSPGAAPATPPDLLPFHVELEVQPANAPNSSAFRVALQPRSNNTVEIAADLPFRQFKTAVVRITTDAGASFSAGTVRITQRPVGTVEPPEQVATVPDLTWNSALFTPNVDINPVRSAFQFDAWRLATGSGGLELLGSAGIRISVQEPRDDVPPTRLTMSVSTEVTALNQPLPGPFPCLGDPCCPGGKPLFPTWPPFLHADPYRPAQPADPKVVALAVLYGWLAGEARRHQLGQEGGATTPALRQAALLTQAAWGILFGVRKGADHTRLGEVLRRLLAAWCRSFLYPGPRCDGEPHGVVLGCVRVEGGDVRELDPWGGRRYVLHGPLLTYWGEQVGIAPLDLTVGRLVALVCCLSRLPLPGSQRDSDGVIDLQGGYLVQGRDAEAEASLRVRSLREVRSEALGASAFAGRVLSLMQAPSTPIEPGQRVVRYTVVGLPDFHLILPEGTAREAPVTPADRLRLEATVRASLENRPTGDAVPPLVRNLSGDLTLRLLDALPLSLLDGGDGDASRRLAGAGIATLGALLSASPEDLHERVLDREGSAELSRLLSSAEAMARGLSGSVGTGLRELSQAEIVRSRADLRDDGRMERLVERLQGSLREARAKLPAETIRAAVASAAERRA